jgi:hypothetical protein
MKTPKREASEGGHTRGEYCPACNLTRDERIAIEQAAEVAWDRAWDTARNKDRRLGRQYDKRIYGEKAARASDAVLAAGGVVAHRRARLAGSLADADIARAGGRR